MFDELGEERGESTGERLLEIGVLSEEERWKGRSDGCWGKKECKHGRNRTYYYGGSGN